MSFNTSPSDLFTKVDVYQLLDNMIKIIITVSIPHEPFFVMLLTHSKNRIGLDVLKPLVDAMMTNSDPSV